MPDINLLPWREEQREQRKNEFFILLAGAAVFAVIIGFLWASWREVLIDAQVARNQILQDEIAVLEQQVAQITKLKKEKVEMIDRMAVIKGLQTNRPEIVKLFDQLARVIPDGVYLTELDVKAQAMSMKGKAESNNRISTFMRELNKSDKFSAPNLTVVNADRELGEQGSKFTMTASSVNLANADIVDDSGGEE